MLRGFQNHWHSSHFLPLRVALRTENPCNTNSPNQHVIQQCQEEILRSTIKRPNRYKKLFYHATPCTQKEWSVPKSLYVSWKGGWGVKKLLTRQPHFSSAPSHKSLLHPIHSVVFIFRRYPNFNFAGAFVTCCVLCLHEGTRRAPGQQEEVPTDAVRKPRWTVRRLLKLHSHADDPKLKV